MRHLLSVDDLARDDLEELLDLGESFLEVTHRDIPKVPVLRGRTVVSLFYEDSTRTRLSFETAAKRLSADTMAFNVSSSSVAKGESLRDTVQTIEAMGIDAIVVRHWAAGVPHRIADWVDAAIVNAGDGRHEHPTQALLDALTLRRHRGTGLDGARIAIVGDVRHSRVACSTTKPFAALGADVTLVGPPTLLPESLAGWPALHLRRPRRAPRPPRRRLPASYPTRTPGRDAVPVASRVHDPRPAYRGSGQPPQARHPRHAPGPDEPRRRDRRRGRREPRVGHHRAGRQRRRGPHGGPLPDPRLRSSRRLSPSSCAAAGLSTPPANAPPTSSSPGRRSPPSNPTCTATGSSTATGCVVAPGLVDLHVHLREPGHEEAETIETGARAAARGGFTVLAMPNTEPPQDDPAVVAAVLAAGARSTCDVHAAGCITRTRARVELAPMGELHTLGVRVFTDDGACVDSAAGDAPGPRVRELPSRRGARPARRGRRCAKAATCTRGSGRAASGSPVDPRSPRRRSWPGTASSPS